VFYKLLLENFPAAKDWRVTAGVFDFIEKNANDEFVRFTVPIAENDVTTVKQQIKDVYNRIMNHEFEEGCNKEDCRWCNFSKQYELTKADAATEIEDVEL
jgi:DNA helicase-2/ATP-dependent DNA helicase PcrA